MRHENDLQQKLQVFKDLESVRRVQPALEVLQDREHSLHKRLFDPAVEVRIVQVELALVLREFLSQESLDWRLVDFALHSDYSSEKADDLVNAPVELLVLGVTDPCPELLVCQVPFVPQLLESVDQVNRKVGKVLVQLSLLVCSLLADNLLRNQSASLNLLFLVLLD